MTTLHVLLPPLTHCRVEQPLAQWLARGDREAAAGPGYLAAVAGFFRTPAPQLPVAALVREALAGDADGSSWLCADPAYVQPDLSGARLLACGNLDLDREQAEALARDLRPMFGDRGCLLETTTPSRWHLRLPRGAQPPSFISPEQAMGDDLLHHLPDGADGRRWRAMLNEAQILLHQNPVNAGRRERGQVPANSLWLWGGGALPAWVKSAVDCVYSDDVLLAALGERARARVGAVTAFDGGAAAGDTLLDLEAQADLTPWWPRLETSLRRGHQSLHLCFASGERLRYRRRHRWRLWRRG